MRTVFLDSVEIDVNLPIETLKKNALKWAKTKNLKRDKENKNWVPAIQGRVSPTGKVTRTNMIYLFMLAGNQSRRVQIDLELGVMEITKETW